MNPPDELISALAPVVSALSKLGVRHYVGGSVASSFHGAVRSTMDVDLVSELDEANVVPFLGQLSGDYYVSESAVRDAVKRRSCFNLIHLPTSFKVDVFISRDRAFDRDCMDRCRVEKLLDQLEVRIATAEDSIIAKLEWYRAGDEVSERQWEDVSKLMQLLGDQADFDYLKTAAASVGVVDLLDRLVHDLSLIHI